jgi:hypothetical protein
MRSYRVRNLFLTSIVLSFLGFWGCDRKTNNDVDEPEVPLAPEFNPETEVPKDGAQADAAPAQTELAPDEDLVPSGPEVDVSEAVDIDVADDREKAIAELAEAYKNIGLESSNLDKDTADFLMGVIVETDPDRIAMLIDAQNDVDVKDEEGGRTALMLASAYSTKPDIVLPALFEAGADPKATDKDGKTPIMYAVLHSPNPAKTIDILVQYGVDPTQKSLTGEAAIDFANLNPYDPQEADVALQPYVQAESKRSFLKPAAAGAQHNAPLPAR